MQLGFYRRRRWRMKKKTKIGGEAHPKRKKMRESHKLHGDNKKIEKENFVEDIGKEEKVKMEIRIILRFFRISSFCLGF